MAGYQQTLLDCIHDSFVGACKLLEVDFGSLCLSNAEQEIEETDYNRDAYLADHEISIGCAIKPITAHLVLDLLHRIKYKTSDEYLMVINAISEVPQQISHMRSVTIHQLLTHTDGLSDESIKRAPIGESGFIDASFTFSYLRNCSPMFSPGQFFSYRNIGYILLGILLERYHEKTYKQILLQYIYTFFDGSTRGSYHTGATSVCPASGDGLSVSSRLLIQYARTVMQYSTDKSLLIGAQARTMLMSQYNIATASTYISGTGYGWKKYCDEWFGHCGITQDAFTLMLINKKMRAAISIAANKQKHGREITALQSMTLRASFAELTYNKGKVPEILKEVDH